MEGAVFGAGGDELFMLPMLVLDNARHIAYLMCLVSRPQQWRHLG